VVGERNVGGCVERGNPVVEWKRLRENFWRFLGGGNSQGQGGGGGCAA